MTFLHFNRLVSMVIICVFFSAGGITACTNIGPIGEASFEKKVRDSIGLDLEPILQTGRVDWFPGVDEYTFGLPKDFQAGILVILDSRLFVLEWKSSAKKYEVLLMIEFFNAKDVRRRVWGASQRIVIELENGETHAFTFLSDNGMGVSVPRINKAIAILRKRIPSSDAHLDEIL